MGVRKPVIHGRDHGHGGADPVLITYEVGGATPSTYIRTGHGIVGGGGLTGWTQELTATDSTYASGYGGISMGSPAGSIGGNRADDFAAATITSGSGTPAPAVVDNFNRADSSSLGSSWTTLASSPLGVAGSMCCAGNYFLGGNWHGSYNAAGPFSNTDSSYVIGGLEASAAGNLWVHARLDPSVPSSGPSCYSAHYDHNAGQLSLEKQVGGSRSTLASKAYSMSVGDTLLIRCFGTTITVWTRKP